MLRNIGITMIILGLILLVVSLILVFALKIPDLLDELSGKKAKRQIKRLKELNIGTGSLEGVATDEFYRSLSTSGSLLSEEYLYENKPKGDSKSKGIKVKDLNTKDTVKDFKSDSSVVNLNGNVGEDSKTQYMREEEDTPTGYIQDDDVTGMLDEVNDFIHTKHVINIIEEQSSL